MCSMTLLWLQDYNPSNKIPHQGCRVPSPVVLVRLCSSQSAFISFLCPSCTFNECAGIHSCVRSHSCSCSGEINPPHKVWTLCRLHTYGTHMHAHTRVLSNVLFFSASLFFGAPVSGWHHDHGCHATRSVFSKTAEDSLAHVTTASRLTCYHGDKPANENSADSCDVDCELFVLRGDLFFPLLSPPSCTASQALLLSARALRRSRTLNKHSEATHTSVHEDSESIPKCK